jgi:hypothetical protein
VLVSNIRHQTLGREVDTLLEKHAVVELHHPFTPGFYSSIFVVPAPGDQSQATEQAAAKVSFQDGDVKIHHIGAETGGLDDFP